MKRRHWGLGLAAVGAAAAGFAWRAGHDRAAGAGPAAAAAGDAPPAGFWALEFPQPDGGRLALAPLRGAPLLVNFWATWCAPCVKEMPDLDRFQRAHAGAGWRVVGIAVDGPTPVREFLQRSPVSFAIGLAGFEGTELARSLGNTANALPFSVVVDRAGRIRHRKLGQTSPEELERWAKTV